MTDITNPWDLVLRHQTLLDLLENILKGSDIDTVTIDGEVRPVIAKDIKDKYDAFKNSVAAFLSENGTTFDEFMNGSNTSFSDFMSSSNLSFTDFMGQADTDVATTIAQVIADINSKWAAIQALVDNTLVFEVKAGMDAYTPVVNANGRYPLAKVWRDVEANNGIYGYYAGAWVKSEYDPIAKIATFDYLKDIIPTGYESDLLGGYKLISEDGFVIARVNSNGVFESLVPFKFVHHPDNPYATPASAQLQIDAAVEPVNARQASLELFFDNTYEADLCGYCVVSEDGFLIARVTSIGVHKVFTSLDISQSPTKFLTPDDLIEQLNVSGYESACWVEKGDTTYLVKAFDYDTGCIATLATTTYNPAPQMDSLNRVIYINEAGAKVWQHPAGSAEFPFLPTNSLICYGDSKTAAGSGYGDIIKSKYPQYSPNIQGIGGQRATPIAARTGGLECLTTVDGNEIPASGSVSISNPTTYPITSPYNFTLRVEIAGVVGMYNCNNYMHTFTRDVEGIPVKTYPMIPMRILSGLIYGSEVLDTINQGVGVFWFGTNDIGKDDYSEDTVINCIKAAISSLRAYCKRYVVLSVPQFVGWVDTAQGGNETLAKSELKFSQVESLLYRCKREFGNALIDVVDYHKDNNPTFITSYTVAGKAYDVLNYSYTTDGIHGNATGRTADADMIIAELTVRGFLQ
jgi:lysophospholipase L1-like esterase